MKKLVVILLSFLIVGILVVGCGKKGSSKSTAKNTAKQSASSTSGKSSMDTSKKDDLEVSGLTFSVREEYIHYSCTITNPNKSIANNTTIELTAKDDNGTILGTSDPTIDYIEAGDTVNVSGYFDITGGNVSTLDAEAKCSTYYDSLSPKQISRKDIIISNTNELRGEYDLKITGEIENKSKSSIDDGKIKVVFKLGEKTVYTSYEYFNSRVEAGGKTAFEVDSYKAEEIPHDSYIVYFEPDAY